MDQQQLSLYELRDWLFERMVAVLLNGDWVIVMKDFLKSKEKSHRKLVGLTVFESKTIFLDEKGGNLSVLCHELGHVVFQDFLLQEGRRSAKIERRKLKGRGKIGKWAEGRVEEWEKCFLGSLDEEQKEILQMFVDFTKRRP